MCSNTDYQRKTTGYFPRMIESLPTRPLPSLTESIGNLLKNLEPLLATEEFGQVSLICQDFIAGAGPVLQQQLHDILDDPQVSNWNAGFWDSMYLTLRDPLPIHSSPFFALSDQDSLKNLHIEAVAAKIVSATNSVIDSIREHSFAPDYSKGAAQDMVQYQRFFGYAREPAPCRDIMLFDQQSDHICVLYKNRLFSLKVFDKDSRPIPTGILQDNIAEIVHGSEARGVNSSFVGYFTAADRDTWAARKEGIRSHSAKNKLVLDNIDRALYVLCIDNEPVVSLRDRAERLLHNYGDNRYFDKYQIVVFQDGHAGSIFEHAPIDAISVGRVWNETIDHLSRQHGSAALPETECDQTDLFEELELDLPPTIVRDIEASRNQFRNLAQRTQQDVVLFEDFGTQALKRMGVSPDACIQLMFQLSYRNAFGKIENTYESVSTRQFREGRTDVLRSVTQESVDFIEQCGSQVDVNALALLKRAVDSITDRRKISSTGSSPDHHLAALNQLALQKQHNCLDYKIPALFEHPGYHLYRKTILSTSNISDPLCLLFGFGPVTPEGLGLAYGTYPHHMVFHLSFFDMDRARINLFRRELLVALDYLQELVTLASAETAG